APPARLAGVLRVGFSGPKIFLRKLLVRHRVLAGAAVTCFPHGNLRQYGRSHRSWPPEVPIYFLRSHMKLANLNIAQRLAIGFGALCFLLVALQAFGLNMIGRVNDGTAELATQRMPNITTTGALLTEVNDVAIA